MSKSVPYEWTDEMENVSGLSGEYELFCREMITAGLTWLDENVGPGAEFSEGENVTARIDEEANEADALRAHMAKTVAIDPSPSMLHLCVKQALYAHEIGWEGYVTRLE